MRTICSFGTMTSSAIEVFAGGTGLFGVRASTTVSPHSAAAAGDEWLPLASRQRPEGRLLRRAPPHHIPHRGVVCLQRGADMTRPFSSAGL